MSISTTPPSPDEPVELWHGGEILQPNSFFSQEVFKVIRPGIPTHGWPVGQPVTGLFMPLPSGMGLTAEFEHLSHDHRKHAEQAVLDKGVSLVLCSPAARAAYAVFQSKRWRDLFMYGLLPMVFAIPIIDGLFPKATHAIMMAAVTDFIGLVAMQLRLGQLQKTLAESRFIAHIPTPGMRIKVGPRNT